MLKFYETQETRVVEIDKITSGCWISAVNPSEDEISRLERELSVDRDFICAALDEEESSRVETEDGKTLIIIDYPVSEPDDSQRDANLRYYTMPLGIILTEKNVVTVTLLQNPIIDDFAHGVVKGVKTGYKTQFIFYLLLRIANKYLQYLKQIDKLSIYIEQKLRGSMRNKELFQLLGLEKSLIYFSTSLKSTETLLEKLLRGRTIRLYDEDKELLEDVLIEIKQAIEMSRIYSGILSSTTEVFSGVISNNLNIVMRVLAVITVVMSMPTMVFSFYGMNVEDLPMANVPFTIILSLALAAVSAIALGNNKFGK